MCAALSDQHINEDKTLGGSPDDPNKAFHCKECNEDFADEDLLHSHILVHVKQPCIRVQRFPSSEPPIRITLKTRNNSFEIISNTEVPAVNGEAQLRRRRDRRKDINYCEDYDFDENSPQFDYNSEESQEAESISNPEVVEKVPDIGGEFEIAALEDQDEGSGQGSILQEAAEALLEEAADKDAGKMVVEEEVIEEIHNPEEPRVPKLRFVQPEFLLKKSVADQQNSQQPSELQSPSGANQRSPAYPSHSPSQPEQENRPVWTITPQEDPLRLPEPDKDVGNLLQTLFNNNDTGNANISAIPSTETEYISLERLGERNKQLQVFNSNSATTTTLDSLGLPMQQLAQQVSRLQPGMHQQNVLINIQQFPQAPQQQPQPPQYGPPPPMHHYGPPNQHPGMYHQPYHMPPPNPPGYTYYPPAYPQMPPQQPPPYRQQMAPPRGPQLQPAMPMPPPLQQQPSPRMQQPRMQQPRMQQPRMQQPRMTQPRMTQQQQSARLIQPRQMQPRGVMTRQRAPMAPRGLMPRGPMPRLMRAPIRQQQGTAPRPPLKRSNDNLLHQQQQQQHHVPMVNKRRRLDMLIPDKHDDADCQVISMQPPPNEGLPVIQNVQGAATVDGPTATAAGGNSDASNVVHLTDSITLSVRNPTQTAPAPVQQKKSDAKAVANILATRGITVTAAAKPKENAVTKQSASTTPPPPVAINLNSAVSIIPAAKPTKTSGSAAHTLTVDLTDDSESTPAAALPVSQHSKSSSQMQGQRGAVLPFRCDLCSAQYPSALGLNKHRQSYHKTGGPSEIGIPLIDLRQPSVLAKLASLGIYNYIPLPGTQPDAMLGLPVISIDAARNPAVCNLAGMGVTSVLTLGPVRSVPPANKQ